MLEHLPTARQLLAAASASRERYRLRDELLGARATSRLGELMGQFN
jgi:hypothetical protein